MSAAMGEGINSIGTVVDAMRPPRDVAGAHAYLQRRLGLWQRELDNYHLGVAQLGATGMVDMMTLHSALMAECVYWRSTSGLDGDAISAAYGALLDKATAEARNWAQAAGPGGDAAAARLAAGRCAGFVRDLVALSPQLKAATAAR